MSLKRFLDENKLKFDKEEFLNSDPILFPKNFKNPEDIEFIAFVSALFSYGNVNSIQKFLEKIFSRFGENPFLNFKSIQLEKKIFYGLKYRFQTEDDLFYFFHGLKILYEDKNSLEKNFGEKDNPTEIRIIHFQKKFIYILENLTKRKISSGLKFLVGAGEKNSTHKRYNMFLRWMTRKNFPDFGIYKSFEEKKLLYPVDVHIGKFSKAIGLTDRKTINIKYSKEITEKILEFEKDDPLKYDFSICRLGILKLCKMKYVQEICEICSLKKVCKIYSSSIK